MRSASQQSSQKRFDELTYHRRVRRLHHLARSALSAYGINDGSVRLIKHREHASTFRIDASSGPQHNVGDKKYVPGHYLLRIHDPKYQTAATVESELAWLNALARDTDLSVPSPVSTLEGEPLAIASTPDVPGPRTCSLLRWMEGRAYRRPRSGRITAIGEVMAKLHNHAERWHLPSGFTRRRFDWDGLLGEGSGFSVSPQEFWTSLSPRYAELFETVSGKIKQAVEDLGTGPGASGLIHADLHVTNVLFLRGNARVIDFDDSGFGAHVLDFAISLLACNALAMQDDFFRGYERHRSAPQDQMVHLETFIAARRLSDVAGSHRQAQNGLRPHRELSPLLSAKVRDIEHFVRNL